MNIWKKILNGFLTFLAIICLGYIIDTFLFKFEFSQTLPSIYDNITGAIGGAMASIFFTKNEFKKSDIYFLIVVIILAIVVYFI